jgi:uncharacterized Zn finger protein
VTRAVGKPVRSLEADDVAIVSDANRNIIIVNIQSGERNGKVNERLRLTIWLCSSALSFRGASQMKFFLEAAIRCRSCSPGLLARRGPYAPDERIRCGNCGRVLTEAPSFFRRGRDRDAPVLTSTRRNEADTGVEIRFPHEAVAEQQFEPGRNTTERSRGRDEKPRQQNKPKHMRKPGSNPALGRTQ